MKQTSFIAVGATVLIIIIAAVALGTYFASFVTNPSSYYDGQRGLSSGTLTPPSPSSLVAVAKAAPLQGFTTVKMASALPSAAPVGATLSGSPPAYWDEQLGLSFTEDFSSIAYNVTAVQQADSDGYGPAYLLNGISNSDYWYQVGLSWNWPYTTGGHYDGFRMIYEVFNSFGISIFPTDGSGGVASFSGNVNSGDTVGLNLYFSNGNVTMYAHDFNTGASAEESFSAEGATLFNGMPSSKTNSNGFFTGLMTEQYHVSPYYGDESSVLYSDAAFSLSSAWMWIDERNSETGQILFSDQSLVYYSGSSFQIFSSNGTSESSNATDFITGTGTWIPMTLSYSIQGGGTPTSAPTLTYKLGGHQYSTMLNASPTIYYMDLGSTWNITNPLSGGSSTEEWTTAQPTSGVANYVQNITFLYYHQYWINFNYTFSGGGSGLTPPNVTVIQCGIMRSMVAPTSTFVDADSQYSFPNPISSSSASERWFTPSPQGSVLSSTTINTFYYHQYALNASYSLTGGGTPSIFLNGTSLGSPVSVEVFPTGSTIWLDQGSDFSMPSLIINSLQTEQWYSLFGLNGSMQGPTSISPVYQHQFYLNMVSDSPAGGSFTPSSEWVGAGQTVWIDSMASLDWQFEGWNGSGLSSYNGSSTSTFITMNSPVTENAVFNPEIKISSGDYGTIVYNYSQGSGSVPSGTSITLYVPLNDSISLTANPSSFFYQSNQWSGAVNSTSSTISFVAQGPEELQVNFVYNWVTIGIVAIVIVVILGAIAWTALRKLKS
jgi:hypothetical protein